MHATYQGCYFCFGLFFWGAGGSSHRTEPCFESQTSEQQGRCGRRTSAALSPLRYMIIRRLFCLFVCSIEKCNHRDGQSLVCLWAFHSSPTSDENITRLTFPLGFFSLAAKCHLFDMRSLLLSHIFFSFSSLQSESVSLFTVFRAPRDIFECIPLVFMKKRSAQRVFQAVALHGVITSELLDNSLDVVSWQADTAYCIWHLQKQRENTYNLDVWSTGRASMNKTTTFHTSSFALRLSCHDIFRLLRQTS